MQKNAICGRFERMMVPFMKKQSMDKNEGLGDWIGPVYRFK
jgi:hypothetical protein